LVTTLPVFTLVGVAFGVQVNAGVFVVVGVGVAVCKVGVGVKVRVAVGAGVTPQDEPLSKLCLKKDS
jgi:hypothetical protein